MFSVIFAFLSTGLGRLIAYVAGGALALVLVWTAGDIHGHSKANAKCQAAALAAQLKAQEIDLRIAKDTAEQAQAAKAEIETKAGELEAKVKEYETELSKRPTAACSLDSDDDRRLRDIK